MTAVPTVGYFSMEIALNATMPLYSGGLGVLAGDTLRSAADLQVPMLAVTLLHRKGYFYQRIDAGGQQREEPVAWVPDDVLRELRGRLDELEDVEAAPVTQREVSRRGALEHVVELLLDSLDSALIDVRESDDLHGERPLGVEPLRLLLEVHR